jgi:hypothetical protein
LTFRIQVAATDNAANPCQHCSRNPVEEHYEAFKLCTKGYAVTVPKPDPIAYPPRGMSRDEAARYVGVGSTKFNEMVSDRRMPRPKRVDGRVIWDRLRLDAAFTDLPEDRVQNPLDRMFR